MRQIGGLGAFTGLIGFFVFVISLTLRMEYFLEMFETLIELDELLEALSCGVKPLDDEFLL